jgi:hypothetical protein
LLQLRPCRQLLYLPLLLPQQLVPQQLVPQQLLLQQLVLQYMLPHKQAQVLALVRMAQPVQQELMV